MYMINSYKDVHNFFVNKVGEDLVINKIYPYSVQRQPFELQKDIISFKFHIDKLNERYITLPESPFYNSGNLVFERGERISSFKQRAMHTAVFKEIPPSFFDLVWYPPAPTIHQDPLCLMFRDLMCYICFPGPEEDALDQYSSLDEAQFMHIDTAERFFKRLYSLKNASEQKLLISMFKYFFTCRRPFGMETLLAYQMINFIRTLIGLLTDDERKDFVERNYGVSLDPIIYPITSETEEKIVKKLEDLGIDTHELT